MKKHLLTLFTMAIIGFCVIGRPQQAQAGQDNLKSKSSLAVAAGKAVENGQRINMRELLGESTTETSENKSDSADDGTTKAYTDWDLELLTCVIYCEANSMDYDPMAAVGNTVINRMNDNDVWAHVSTIEQVIYDRKWGGYQFSTAKPNKSGTSAMDRAKLIYEDMSNKKWKEWQVKAMTECKQVALDVLNGYKVVPDDFVYFNGYIEKSTKTCLEKGTRFLVMGAHIYFAGK